MPDKDPPDFSNVAGGSSSTAKPAQQPAPAAVKSYTVQKGDTLWKIAKEFYGKGSAWPRIHEANKDLIKNPDVIQPGWTLRIPE